MPRPSLLSESAAWLLMRRVVFASDDPRLETRGEAVRSIVDAALRIARDGVDNLVSFDELAAFPSRFRDVLERPSTRKGTVVYGDVAEAEEKVGALALLADLAREYAAEKRRIGVLDFSDQVAGALEVVRSPPGRRRRGARPVPRRPARRVPGHVGGADRPARRALRAAPP